MDDGAEIERRSRAMVEAQRPVRYWLQCPDAPEPVDDPELDELERRTAAVELAVDQLERRLAPVRVALGLGDPAAAQGCVKSAIISSTTSPNDASTRRNRRISRP